MRCFNLRADKATGSGTGFLNGYRMKRHQNMDWNQIRYRVPGSVPSIHFIVNAHVTVQCPGIKLTSVNDARIIPAYPPVPSGRYILLQRGSLYLPDSRRPLTSPGRDRRGRRDHVVGM